MPRSTYLLEYGRHVARRRRRRRRGRRAMLTMKKEMHGCLFLCMHVVPLHVVLFPVVMVLRLAALRAAGAPL